MRGLAFWKLPSELAGLRLARLVRAPERIHFHDEKQHLIGQSLNLGVLIVSLDLAKGTIGTAYRPDQVKPISTR
jgi:hypothetical protein